MLKSIKLWWFFFLLDENFSGSDPQPMTAPGKAKKFFKAHLTEN